MQAFCAALSFMCMVAVPSFAATVHERTTPCFVRHGEEGQSENVEVPSLGAQPSSYTLIRLYYFEKSSVG